MLLRATLMSEWRWLEALRPDNIDFETTAKLVGLYHESR